MFYEKSIPQTNSKAGKYLESNLSVEQKLPRCDFLYLSCLKGNRYCWKFAEPNSNLERVQNVFVHLNFVHQCKPLVLRLKEVDKLLIHLVFTPYLLRQIFTAQNLYNHSFILPKYFLEHKIQNSGSLVLQEHKIN